MSGIQVKYASPLDSVSKFEIQSDLHTKLVRNAVSRKSPSKFDCLPMRLS